MISAHEFMVMKRDKEKARKAAIEEQRLRKIAAEENKPKRVMKLLELLQWGQQTLNGRDVDGVELCCELRFNNRLNEWEFAVCEFIGRNVVLSVDISDVDTFSTRHDNKSCYLQCSDLDTVTKCICEELVSMKADQNQHLRQCYE
mgnify:CR=1 FL=1